MTAVSIQTDDSRISCKRDEDGIAVVRILRSEKRNALSLSMWETMGKLFLNLGKDAAVRCVILTGDKGHFSAGADISEFPKVRANAEQGLAYDRINDETTLAIRNCPKPVIAAISGVAVGGGLGLALACDFRVADNTARMGITAGRMGLVYSLVDCSLLTERVGVTNAKWILFSSAIFDIDASTKLGLVDRHATEDVLKEAREMALSFIGNAPLSMAGNKHILNAIADGTLKQRSAELEGYIATAFNSEDYVEAQKAFSERRSPAFHGR